MADEIVKPPEEQTREELAASIAAETEKQHAPEPQEEKPAEKQEEKQKFEYRAGDGTLYTAESQEDLFKKVTQAKEVAAAALKDRERQIFDLRQQIKHQSDEKKPTPPKEEIHQKLEEDPDTAMREAVRRELGIDDPAELARFVQEQRAAKARMEALAVEVAAFEKSKAGQEYVTVQSKELSDKMVEYMNDNGISMTASGFAQAFYELKNEKQITPATRPRVPPKTPDGTGEGRSPETELSEAQLMRMPKEKLAEYMRAHGMQV